MTKSRKKGKKNGKRRKGRENGKYYVNVVPRGLLAPPRTRVSLCFSKLTAQTQGLSTTTNTYFNVNNVYDIDPAVGSTALPGFDQYSGLYRFYRINRFRATVAMFPNDANQFIGVVGVLNANPGINSATYTAQKMLAQPSRHTMWQPLPNSSNSVYKFRLPWVDLAEFAGTRYTGQYDPYSGPTSGVSPPGNIMFLWVGAQSQSAMTNGITFQLVLECEVEFFELQTPTT